MQKTGNLIRSTSNSVNMTKKKFAAWCAANKLSCSYAGNTDKGNIATFYVKGENAHKLLKHNTLPFKIIIQ